MLPADRKPVSARMKPPLRSFRTSKRKFWWDALVAAVCLAIAAAIVVATRHVQSNHARRAIGLVVVLVLYRPLMLVLPPLLIAMLAVLEKITPHKEYTPYACPKCGYDVRATLSRCPECGTELRWGMLPHDPRQ